MREITKRGNQVNTHFLGDTQDEDIQKIYGKLFYGCNLPAIKMDEQDFLPEWEQEEIEWIFEILENGFQILSDALS